MLGCRSGIWHGFPRNLAWFPPDTSSPCLSAFPCNAWARSACACAQKRRPHGLRAPARHHRIWNDQPPGEMLVGLPWSTNTRCEDPRTDVTDAAKEYHHSACTRPRAAAASRQLDVTISQNIPRKPRPISTPPPPPLPPLPHLHHQAAVLAWRTHYRPEASTVLLTVHVINHHHPSSPQPLYLASRHSSGHEAEAYPTPSQPPSLHKLV